MSIVKVPYTKAIYQDLGQDEERMGTPMDEEV